MVNGLLERAEGMDHRLDFGFKISPEGFDGIEVGAVGG